MNIHSYNFPEANPKHLVSIKSYPVLKADTSNPLFLMSLYSQCNYSFPVLEGAAIIMVFI